MAEEHDDCTCDPEDTEADIQEIRALIERIAERRGHNGSRATAFIFAFEYLDGNVDQKWGFRYDPENGWDASIRLGKLVELQTDFCASQMFGFTE